MKDIQNKKVLVVGHGNVDAIKLYLSDRGVEADVVVVDEKDNLFPNKPDLIEFKMIERDDRYIPIKPKQDGWKRPYKYHK